MKILVSVVSFHHNADVIKNLKQNFPLPENVIIVITDLAADDNFEKIIQTQYSKNVIYYRPEGRYGYGKNNNIAFKLFGNDCDIFIVCNPDVFVNLRQLSNFLITQNIQNSLFAFRTFNENGNPEYNIRRFFDPWNWFLSFIGKVDKNYWYYADSLGSKKNFEWCSGGFMVFDSSAYEKLGGFDENYFMYLEDVDLCRRCDMLGVKKVYFPEFSVIHLGQRKNKNIFSKHFFWFIRSMIRYYSKSYPKIK